MNPYRGDAVLTAELGRLIARRLRLFAGAWLGATLVWTGVLFCEEHLSLASAALVVAFEAALLGLMVVICRVLDDPARVLTAAVSGSIVLGASTAGVFFEAGANGDFLAYVLLTLYLSSSLFFGWGWRSALVLLGTTVAVWFLVLPRLAVHVPQAELFGAILVGSALSVGIAEGYARSFRNSLRHERERDAVRVRERAALDVAERLRAIAEQATQSKDRLLAIVSHDLRSPLSAVLSWAYVLRGEELDAATKQRATDAIERSTDTCLRLIRDLLDMSQIASGKLHLEMSRVDLRGVVSAVVDSARPAADEKRLGLTTRLPPAEVQVQGDAVRLRQIVDNLLSNAVKFTPEGGSIDIELQGQPQGAELTVRDTGVGIPESVLPHVFEPFWQATDADMARSKGVGLGLAIVRQLADAHGATIEAESEGECRGATFRVRFPVPRRAGDPSREGAPRLE